MLDGRRLSVPLCPTLSLPVPPSTTSLINFDIKRLVSTNPPARKLTSNTSNNIFLAHQAMSDVPSKSTDQLEQPTRNGRQSDKIEINPTSNTTTLPIDIDDSFVMLVEQFLKTQAMVYLCSYCKRPMSTSTSIKRWILNIKGRLHDKPEKDIVHPNGIIQCRVCGKARPNNENKYSTNWSLQCLDICSRG